MAVWDREIYIYIRAEINRKSLKAISWYITPFCFFRTSSWSAFPLRCRCYGPWKVRYYLQTQRNTSNTWIFENNYYAKFNEQEWKMVLSWRNQYTIPPFTWITWGKQCKYLCVWGSSVQIQIDRLRQWIIHVTVMPTLAGSQNLKTMENMTTWI
jgi:hypothetical protein